MIGPFLDTNILLYSISRDPSEEAKRERAVALLEVDNNAISVQVLQEFYVQATRPTRRHVLPHDIASGLIRTWLRFKVQETTVPIITEALRIKTTYRLSYWDAAIVAAARTLGCRELYTEDMADGRKHRGHDHHQSVSLKAPAFTAAPVPESPPPAPRAWALPRRVR